MGLIPPIWRPGRASDNETTAVETPAKTRRIGSRKPRWKPGLPYLYARFWETPSHSLGRSVGHTRVRRSGRRLNRRLVDSSPGQLHVALVGVTGLQQTSS